MSAFLPVNMGVCPDLVWRPSQPFDQGIEIVVHYIIVGALARGPQLELPGGQVGYGQHCVLGELDQLGLFQPEKRVLDVWDPDRNRRSRTDHGSTPPRC